MASDIYDWAELNGYINGVCTIYELHSGKNFSMRKIKLLLCCVVATHYQINLSRLLEHDCFTLTGEDVNGMSFQGADEDLLRRALTILEDQGKCTIFKGETSSDDGIKFF